jgi:hypothetical protein
VGQNGLALSMKGLDSNADGEAETGLNIQPMINEESPEVQTLETTSNYIFNTGFAMTLFQFLLTYILSTSLKFFWNLINS